LIRRRWPDTQHSSAGRRRTPSSAKPISGAHAGDISFSEGGIINPLYYEHGTVKAKLNGVLTHLIDLLDKASSELTTAAQQYRTTDAAAAARVDESYPSVERPFARKD
jgi:hypothetical protein